VNPASAGSLIRVYATGLGQMYPAGQDGLVVISGAAPAAPALPLTAQVGGLSATVTSAAGMPGLVLEVVQLNIALPQQHLAAGAASLTVQINGQNSQPGITIAVRQ